MKNFFLLIIVGILLVGGYIIYQSGFSGTRQSPNSIINTTKCGLGERYRAGGCKRDVQKFNSEGYHGSQPTLTASFYNIKNPKKEEYFSGYKYDYFFKDLGVTLKLRGTNKPLPDPRLVTRHGNFFSLCKSDDYHGAFIGIFKIKSGTNVSTILSQELGDMFDGCTIGEPFIGNTSVTETFLGEKTMKIYPIWSLKNCILTTMGPSQIPSNSTAMYESTYIITDLSEKSGKFILISNNEECDGGVCRCLDDVNVNL